MYPRRHDIAGLVAALVLLTLFALAAGCGSPVQRHQKGGRTAQTLGAPPAAAPLQTLQQPENPEGRSVQELRRTTTTTAPTGEVVTTVEVAHTEIGGSQDLAQIIKQAAASDYFRRIALALILAVLAFAVRREWPSLQWVFGLGAVAVAFFGLPVVLVVAGLGGGIVLAYHILSARLRPL